MFSSLFKKKWPVDTAIESILSALVKFDRMQVWGKDLSSVPGLDTERAKLEMFFLDCFAIYIVLKFSHSPGWKENGVQIFEKIFQACSIIAATTYANRNTATMEDAKQAGIEIDRRFAEYGPLFESSEDAISSIGTAFARFCKVERNATLIRIGGELFNVRGQMLTQFSQEHPLCK